MKILFTPMSASSLAHMARLFAIADEMIKRGHEILFTASVDRADFISKCGYPVFEKTCPSINFNDPEDRSINYLKDHHQDFLDWFAVEIVAAMTFKPDVVITSPGFIGPHITYKTGIPTVSILNSQYLDESVGVIGLSLIKDTFVNKLIRTLIKSRAEEKFTQLYANEIFGIYRDLGIPFIGKTRKDLYKGMDVIIPSLKEIEPIESTTDFLFSGPLYWNGFEEKYSVDFAELESFRKGRKLIYLSFGGSVFNIKFYENIFELIANLPYAFIVSTGPNINPEEVVYNAANTKIAQFLPGLKMCQMADLVICTGSHGTIMQALKYSKPVICIPCNIDQSFFAYRIEELGIGFNINKTNLIKFSKNESYFNLNKNIGKKMRKAIQTILNNDSYYSRAAKYSKLIEQSGNGAINISNYIEEKYGN